ncbi:hypothetical protein COU54_04145 [Candidatus Pacearchaeota archaeon CG10_big_fil_rev_8_21_14_0_10_31_24]|nr:MAG: hypothetical protein COU54_04145 [Candidatus Pacearchaeota archaeon CG10_big_fil_rev_8_21_14_0_10_31_24]
MTNKFVTIIFLSLGVLILLFFGIDLMSNKTEKNEEFDFSGITRPIFYDESPIQGATDSKIILYEYADFNCPSCLAGQKPILEIMKKYGKQVSHVWKDFPFLAPSSVQAAIAARCAENQGKFWEYHDWLFTNQGVLETTSFESGAKLLNLDIENFTACLLDDKIASLVQRDFAEAQALGIGTTPTLVIGDVALVGIVSFAEIEKALLINIDNF